jgi:hypothetical protein
VVNEEDTPDNISPPSRTNETAIVEGKKLGRPTKLTPEIGNRLGKLVAVGIPLSVACQVEGITKKTLRNWRKKAADGEQDYIACIVELDKALAKAEVAITMNVVKAAQVDWRAGAWWLERRRPERYGAKQTVTIEKAPADMSDDELDSALARHGYARVEDDEISEDDNE